MVYRTRTYIAADWDNDSNAVQQLNYWNDNKYFSLSFTNAHDLQQARDSSLNCSIKRSLGERLDASHTFVLIVGNNTKTVRSGRCQYCNSYNSYGGYCARGYSVDNRSYIEYTHHLSPVILPKTTSSRLMTLLFEWFWAFMSGICVFVPFQR